MDSRIVFLLVGLGVVHGKFLHSCNITRRFVDGHNELRLKLARGEVPGQPAASNMAYLTWDDDLAKVATKWASRNKFKHNPKRTEMASGKFDYVGENIYQFQTTDSKFRFDPKEAIQAWWNEFKHYTYGKITQKSFQKSSPMIGHYTQMAWAKTVKVGCGISQFQKHRWNSFLVVCNYGNGGNYNGELPYETGKGASGHLECRDPDSGCNQAYGKEC